jgi:tetratricopeptide (TPR) repeat protein
MNRATAPIPKLGQAPPAGRRATGAVPTLPPEPELPDMPFDLSLPDATDDERAALVEDIEVTDEDRRRILAMARLVSGRDPYALIGVPAGSDPRLLKRAYFRVSKDIHPDRFYGKRLGSFADRMNDVFEAVSRAYAKLTSPQPEGASRSATNLRSVQADKPQTPQEYAVELFTRACTLEVNGDAMNAMKLFAAAVRVDPQPRYLRRAATCALAAGQPKTAVEYAKKAHADAPDDVSTARLLAQAFKGAGKLADAEEVLVMAMALKNENDVLTSELRRDLADVRRLLANP